MKLKGIVLVLLGAACFGFTPIFVKTGFQYGYSLGQLNITQMVVAVLFLWVLCLFKGLRVKGLTKQSLLKIMMTGTFVGLTSILYYASMQYLSASLAIILLFQFVWIGMIYEWVFNKSKPTKVNIVALVVTLAGVVFASNIIGRDVSEFSIAGLVLGFFAGVSYAGFIFFSGKVETDTHPLVRSSIMVSGSLILVMILFIQDVPTIDLTDGRLWSIGAGVALVGAVIPPMFFAGGAPLISSRLSNVLTSIELPVTIIAAMIFLSEPVSISQWIGILLIITAIMINQLYGNTEEEKQRDDSQASFDIEKEVI
ncbi:EamA family transporter [Aquibacillus sediminis]|uniref:EamA family transporter n=1 Tax=Aquibacillus sediminis TaxID=2574734 RepID=UPI001108F439|nr:DMT family transporter [Aquibacillus sediminis]